MSSLISLRPLWSARSQGRVRTSPVSALGFTLIELMTVIAIVAVVVAFAIPSWRSLTVSSRIRGAVNDFSLAASFARSEAVRRNAPVVFCPSADGSTCSASKTAYEVGWIVKTGGTTSSGTDVVLQDFPPVDFVTISSNRASAMQFLPNGLPVANFAGFHITVTPSPSTASDGAFERHLCVARTGRIRVFDLDGWLAIPGSSCAA